MEEWRLEHEGKEITTSHHVNVHHSTVLQLSHSTVHVCVYDG